MSELGKKDELAELKTEVAQLKAKVERQEAEIAQLKGNITPQFQLGKKTRIAILVISILFLLAYCLFIAFIFAPYDMKWFVIAGIIAVYCVVFWFVRLTWKKYNP